jgi:hypothetical protein
MARNRTRISFNALIITSAFSRFVLGKLVAIFIR